MEGYVADMTTNYPQYDPYQPPYGGYPLPPYSQYGPPPAPPPPSKRQRLLTAGLALLLAGGVAGGVAIAVNGSDTVSGAGSAAIHAPTIPGDMHRSSGTSTSAALATAAQQQGVVTVVSLLKYQQAESAGTGMVLTSDGEVLTNNHVVQGATKIVVTIASTGKSYRADVVGTDPSDDVAVVQLRNAAGLQTANIGDSSDVAVGDDIVGVGNAGGTGTLRAAAGTVTALNRSITATDELGRNSEKLTGLIQVHAAIVSGDSGGPLYDADDEVIGMDTAASAHQEVDSTAYAIPIDAVLAIVDKIESGVQTAKIHIGLPAFLGVSVAGAHGDGALEQGLLSGGPAASAGITDGSVVTAVGGKPVSSPTSLKAVLGQYEPGDRAAVSWTRPDGSHRTVTVTLGPGPAD
jgi:S1-C subfamily serine protease